MNSSIDNETEVTANGKRIVYLDPDVAEYFPTSESVNEALRFLIRIMKQHQSELNPK